MFEFGARIILAGLILLLAGATGAVGFSLALGAAIALGLMALAAHALHAHDLYDGPGAALHASLEGLVLALLITDLGRADSLGFLALVPYAWVAARRRAPWAPGAFAGAFALVAAHALSHRSEPPPAVLLQAAAALGFGLLLALRPNSTPVAEAIVPIEDLEIRGRFRALREAYSLLESRSSSDAHAAALGRAKSFDAIAQTVRDATSAVGCVLLAPTDDVWQSIGSAGSVPTEISGPYRSGRAAQEKGAVMLFAAGRPVGAVWVPEEARDGLAAIAESLSVRLSDRMEAELERRKRRSVELRATLVERGDSPEAVARALAEAIGADSVEIGVIGPFGPSPLGVFGPPCALPNALRHETGPGLAGWVASGAPLVWVADARSDARLDGGQALRARTAALALTPLADGRAYAWAAWHTPGVGRPTALATMRATDAIVDRWIVGASRVVGSREGLAA